VAIGCSGQDAGRRNAGEFERVASLTRNKPERELLLLVVG
jgi:hypothetical protein